MAFHLRSPDGPSYEINQLLYVGRDPSCAIRPPDTLVSRVHACVWLDRGTVRVRDERSSNGTFVNGTRLTAGLARTIQAGDQVQFGDSLFQLYSDDRGTGSAPALGVVLPPEPAAQDPTPVFGSAPVAYAAPPPEPYVPPPSPYPVAPTVMMPGSGYAPPARAPRPGPNWSMLLLGGCAGVLTLVACGAVLFFVTPIGWQWLAGLFSGG